MDVDGLCAILVRHGMPAVVCHDTGSTVQNLIPLFQYVVTPIISVLTLVLWIWTWRKNREHTMYRDVEARLQQDHQRLDHTLHAIVDMFDYPGAAKTMHMPVYEAGMLVNLLDLIDWGGLAAKPVLNSGQVLRHLRLE
jgi:hypothetical protein